MTTEILPKKCDYCGTHMIVKVRAAPGRPYYEWYYWCYACQVREIFMEEPMED